MKRGQLQSLARCEGGTGSRNFKTFDRRQAVGFKDGPTTSGLAPARILATLNDLNLFFGWLALQPGFKRAVKAADIDYFNLSHKAVRAAAAPAEKAFPTLKMVEKAVAAMPSETAVETRDRELIVFTAITGVRDGALITLKLKHFDEARRLVVPNPREVSTKFSKRIETFLFPLNAHFKGVFLDRISCLRNEELFGDHDPLFPKTAIGQDADQCLAVEGLSREHWANATPARTIFKDALRRVGLRGFTPHLFRTMIVSEMYRRGLSVQEFKAWSQNLGHEGAMATPTSHGKIGVEEQGRLVRNSGSQAHDEAPPTMVQPDAAPNRYGL